MMGGIDVCIPTRAGDSSMEASVRAIRQHWRQAVFENGATGESYGTLWEVPFGEINEVFVYTDEEAAKLWDEEGAVPAAKNAMIHLLIEPGRITVVFDEKDETIQQIVAAITSAVSDASLCVGAL